MKTPFTLIVLLMLFSGQVFGQQFKEANAYNDYIVDLQNQIGERMLAFNEAVSMSDATRESVQPDYDTLLLVTKNCIAKLKKLPAYEGNVSLRNTAQQLFEFYQKTIEQDYKEMVDLIFGSTLDEAALARLTVIMEKITADEKVYDENFAKEQQAFATKYNFELIDNTIQEEIDGLDD